MKICNIFGVLFISLSLLSGCVSAGSKNTHWEYKVITIDYLSEGAKNVLAASPFTVKSNDGKPLKSDDFNERASIALNLLGEDGWELINVSENTYTLRRAK